MGRILVGTASWTDKSLIAAGRFYPAASPQSAPLLSYREMGKVKMVDIGGTSAA
jgi:hypothetical protein